MYCRVISFLNRHNFFFENPFGFRKKCSISQAILLLINSITNSFNKNEKSLAIFLDLSKPFDTISIEILLKKLDHYGIRGLAYIWFKNYLLNRKQTSCLFWYFITHKQFINHGFSARIYLRPTPISCICE